MAPATILGRDVSPSEAASGYAGPWSVGGATVSLSESRAASESEAASGVGFGELLGIADGADRRGTNAS